MDKIEIPNRWKRRRSVKNIRKQIEEQRLSIDGSFYDLGRILDGISKSLMKWNKIIEIQL